eukprot:3112299-Rhodomonas_salina.2
MRSSIAFDARDAGGRWPQRQVQHHQARRPTWLCDGSLLTEGEVGREAHAQRLKGTERKGQEGGGRDGRERAGGV